MLNGLDLFSGIGGVSEALAPWVRTVAYCENDPGVTEILLSRMARGEIHIAPVCDDVRFLKGFELPRIDIISGGFPCTDISGLGRREGLGAERSGLFWEIIRLSRETDAAFVFIENVWPAVRKFIPTIGSAFESIGFRCRGGHLQAADVGAAHERERYFLVAAHAGRIRRRVQSGGWVWESWKKDVLNSLALGEREIANSDGVGVEKNRRRAIGAESKKPFSLELLEGNDWDERAAFLLGVDSGLSHRGDRVRALGNTNPPSQYAEAFKKLMGIG